MPTQLGLELIQASAAGKLEEVRELLKNYPQLNEPDAQGQTALEAAAANGHFAVVKLLVNAGADLTRSREYPAHLDISAFLRVRAQWNERIDNIAVNPFLGKMEETFPNLQSARGKKVVLVMGYRGVGKSTTINLLCGAKVVEKEIKKNYFVMDVEGESFTPIGHDAANSKTFTTQVVVDQGSGIAYCDTPGYRRPAEDETPLQAESRLCELMNIRITVALAKEIKSIIFVMTWEELTGNRGDLFQDFLHNIAQILDLKTLLMRETALIFAVTKVPPGHKYNKDRILDDLKNYLQTSFEELAKLESRALAVRVEESQDEALIAQQKADRLSTEKLNQRIQLLDFMVERFTQIVLFKDDVKELNQGTARRELLTSLGNPELQLIPKETIRLQRLTQVFDRIAYKVAETASPIMDYVFSLPQEIEISRAECADIRATIDLYQQVQTRQILSIEKQMKEATLRRKQHEQANLSGEISRLEDELTNINTADLIVVYNDTQYLRAPLNNIIAKTAGTLAVPGVAVSNMALTELAIPIFGFFGFFGWLGAKLNWRSRIRGAIITSGGLCCAVGGLSCGTAATATTAAGSTTAVAVSAGTFAAATAAGAGYLSVIAAVGAGVDNLVNSILDCVIDKSPDVPAVALAENQFLLNNPPFNRTSSPLRYAALPDCSFYTPGLGQPFSYITYSSPHQFWEVTYDPQTGKFSAIVYNEGLRPCDISLTLSTEKRLVYGNPQRIEAIRRSLGINEQGTVLPNGKKQRLIVLDGEIEQLVQDIAALTQQLEQPVQSEHIVLQQSQIEMLDQRKLEAEQRLEQFNANLVLKQRQLEISERELAVNRSLFKMIVELGQLLNLDVESGLMYHLIDTWGALVALRTPEFLLHWKAPISLLTPSSVPFLQRIVGGKYTNAAQPLYVASRPKLQGAEYGLFFKKNKTKKGKESEVGKEWLGKLSIVSLGAKELEKLAAILGSCYRVGTARAVVVEKIGGDLCLMLGQDLFDMAKMRLAKLPVQQTFMMRDERAIIYLEEVNRDRPPESKITDALYVMSKVIPNYQDLGKLSSCVDQGQEKTFLDCLQQHRIPETVTIAGNVFPLTGILALLAVLKLTAEIDGLGRFGTNAGFFVQKDQATGQVTGIRICKVDPGYSFHFKEAEIFTDRFNKDLQYFFEGENPRDSFISWDGLSKTQKNEFLSVFDQGLRFLREPGTLDFILRRGQALSNSNLGKEVWPESYSNEIKANWYRWLDLQEACYEEELTLYRCEKLRAEPRCGIA